MFWDDLVRRWRKDNRTLSPRLLLATGGQVAALPAPRRARQARPLLLLLAILALLLLLLFGSGRVSVVTQSAEPANPPSMGLIE